MLDTERTQFGPPSTRSLGPALAPGPQLSCLTAVLLWRNLRAFEGRSVVLGTKRALAVVCLDSDTNKPWVAASGGSAGIETASSLWDVAPREASGDRPFKLTLTVTPAGGF